MRMKKKVTHTHEKKTANANGRVHPNERRRRRDECCMNMCIKERKITKLHEILRVYDLSKKKKIAQKYFCRISREKCIPLKWDAHTICAPCVCVCMYLCVSASKLNVHMQLKRTKPNYNAQTKGNNWKIRNKFGMFSNCDCFRGQAFSLLGHFYRSKWIERWQERDRAKENRVSTTNAHKNFIHGNEKFCIPFVISTWSGFGCFFSLSLSFILFVVDYYVLLYYFLCLPVFVELISEAEKKAVR